MIYNLILLNSEVLIIIFISSILLSIVINVLSYLLSSKNPSKEKVTSYECGFDPIYSPGKPFSIKFFIIGLLFLIFDLEIIFLFPWAATTSIIPILNQIIIYFFILFLIIGLIYE
tara:strand:+ start:9595 stop:9939 length:345 start_codon:yes stop_codon:yes gene_type:complete